MLPHSPSTNTVPFPSAIWKRGASILYVMFLSNTRRRERTCAATVASAAPISNRRPQTRLFSVAMTGVAKDIGRLPGEGLFFPCPKLASALFNKKPPFVSNCEPNHTFSPLKENQKRNIFS